MAQGPINRRRPRSVMGHEDNLLLRQLFDYSSQFTFLVCGSIGILGRFIGGAPAKKIERNQLGALVPGKEQAGHKDGDCPESHAS